MKIIKFLIVFLIIVFKGNSQCITVNSNQYSMTSNACISGQIGVLELNGKTLTIPEGSTLEVKNINGVGTIITEKKSLFRLQSSLNMNGNFKFINNGISNIQTIEMQNGTNTLENYGEINVTEFQESSNGSYVLNCGTITVSNATNFHAGRFEFCNCGVLITNLLNVNATIVYGKGVITVNQVLNLNAVLSTDTSGKLAITYPKKINKPENLGVVVKDGTCSGPLPVDIQRWKVTKIGNGYLLTIVFAKIVNVREINIQFSGDTKTWKTAVKLPTNLIPGKEYQFPINF